MLLYKLRDFSKMDRILDILLMERLYCSEYKDLNDPFEAMFHMKKYLPECFSATTCSSTFGGTDEVKTALSVIDHFETVKNKRVCSLSQDISSVLLWSYYAAGHTGIAIEINIPGEHINEVTYPPDLPTFQQEQLTKDNVKKILTTKTAHWDHESEYRILHHQEYFDIKGNITRIIAGPRATEANLELLKRAVPKIPIERTRLNQETIKVEFNKTTNNPSPG